jgi:membrane protease YdiL (CAAX protease family)
MNQPSPARVDWRAVCVFFALACAWSWPLFWFRDMHWDAWLAWRFPMPLKNTLLMWGPGVAALVCFRLFARTHRRTVTLTGGARLRALAFYFVPQLALAIVGLPMPELGGTVHAFALAVAVVGLINVLGEELGWRGFLQDALRPLPRAARYVAIGLLWAAWHFTNLWHGREGAELALHLAWYLPLTIALAALIGEATDRGRAVLIAVTLHAWVDAVWEFPGIGTYAVLALSIPFWGWMLWTWPAAPRPPAAAAT